MNMQRSLILARRVIQQLAGDRRTIALILVVPLIVLTVAGILVRAESSAMVVAVVMADEGTTVPLRGEVNLGQKLTDTLSSLNDKLVVKPMSADEAASAIQRSEVDAVVTLAKDFSSASAATRELNIPAQFEGSNPMKALLIEASLTRASIQTLASLSVIGDQVASAPPVHIQKTYQFGGEQFDSFDYLAPVFIAMFAFLFVFILTSVSFLRERVAGTLERLQATPIRSVEIVVGYMLGFSVFAFLQALIILGYTIFVLRVHYAGSLAVVFLVVMLLTLVAVNLGIFFSTFARNEFQVVQFIPLVVVTQILLSGALWSLDDMPVWLKPVAWLMPLTHANQALRDVMIKGYDLGYTLPYVLALLAFAAALIGLSAQTIRRSA